MVGVYILFSSSASKLKAKAVRLSSLKTCALNLKKFFDKTILFENRHPP